MAGRKPIKLTKKHYDTALRLSSNGLSRGMIAQALGMSEATLYRRIETDAKLKEVLTLGDTEDLQLCVSVLREKALNGSAMHMDRYLQLRHSLYVGNARPNGFEPKAGPTIVVIPFETNQAEWQGRERIIDGERLAHLDDESQEEIAHEIEHNLIEG